MIKSIFNKFEDMALGMINVDRYLPLQIDITNACNLRCAHCYHPHHKNEGSISLENWKEIILQYKTLITKMRFRPSLVICGGEPMVSPFLIPILDFIASGLPESEISILTNGTLVTENLARTLSQYNGLRFQVSLDGPDSNRHDSIRGKGNFDKALRGISILKNHNMKVNVLSVLSKRTEVWMEDFFKLAVTHSFDSMNFTRFVPEGYGRRLLESHEDEPLVGLDLKSAYMKLISLMAAYGVRSKAQGPLFELLMPGLGRSGKFWEAIIVDYQGFVVASSRAKLRLGNALTEGLESIFLKHPVYRALRRGQIEGCGKCPLVKVCGGDRNAAFAASGNFLGMDPGCWKNEEEQITLREAL